MPTVPRWERFEAEFTSTTKYRVPLHDARVVAEFTSPSGARFKAEGFWDGGSLWRLRFAPGELGEWSYRMSCSDPANRGLHNRSGRFLCTAARTGNRFAEHGPVQVAADGRHFEHADHTPFLWLGDAAWDTTRTAPLKAAQNLATQRAAEKFTAIHCTLSPGTDAGGEVAFSGKSPRVINLGFCRCFDAKIESFNKAGLLVALAPLSEIGIASAQVLPEDEAVAFLRYAVARWGSHHVTWIVAVEGQTIGARVSRWQRIGRTVFSDVAHGQVILLPGETPWLLDEFRGESWVDALGYQTTQAVSDDGLQWLFAGPLASEWQKSPARPLINLSPPVQASPRFDAEQARRLLWWSALLQPVAGTSCGTEGSLAASTKAVSRMSELFNDMEFWRLRPLPRAVVGQPGTKSPRRQIAAAGTERKDLLLVYVPEERTLELAPSALPASPLAVWFNPRTGETAPARFALDGSTAKLVTPAAGDWLLVVKTSR